MKKLFITLLIVTPLLFACGESSDSSVNTEIKQLDAIEVSTEGWEEKLSDQTIIGDDLFSELSKISDASIISEDKLKNEADKTLAKINDILAEVNAYTITGENADKLSATGNQLKESTIDYFNALANYCSVVKKNAGFLTAEEWGDEEDDKFDELILPAEDKVFDALDESDSVADQFYKEIENL